MINHHAVDLIEAGKLEAAMHVLSRALDSTQSMLDNLRSDDLPLKSSLDQFMSQTSSSCHSVEQQQQQHGNGNMTMFHAEGEQSFLYNRPIRITDYCGIGSNLKSGVLISAVILFNLALSHQLLGLQKQRQTSGSGSINCSSSTYLLQKSLRLYQLALTVHNDLDEDSGLIFPLATMNNLGLLCRSINDDATAAKYFERLLSALLFVADHGESSFLEFDAFFRNASYLISQECAAAAA